MLSESEKSWLEGRKSLCSRCDCYLEHLMGTASCWDGVRKGWDVRDCRMFYRGHVAYVDYADAAKFEALVAAKLALNTHPVPCIEHGCPHKMPNILFCVSCRLKYARLAVEEEMECAK